MVSIDCKHGELKEFQKLLINFKNHKPITTKTKNGKDRILENVSQLYDKYFDAYKKYYDSENLNKRDEIFFDPNRFKMLDRKKENQSGLKKKLKEKCKNHYALK